MYNLNHVIVFNCTSIYARSYTLIVSNSSWIVRKSNGIKWFNKNNKVLYSTASICFNLVNQFLPKYLSKKKKKKNHQFLRLLIIVMTNCNLIEHITVMDLPKLF